MHIAYLHIRIIYIYIVPKVGAKDEECMYAPVVAPKQSFALSNLLPGHWVNGSWLHMFHMNPYVWYLWPIYQ